jgi:DNA repair protein RecN (Recombination protein N)
VLRSLGIRDYAVIRSLAVPLGPGLTVITGESGAGKSILLEALALCLGQRATSSVVRPGAARAEVIAEFSLGDDCAAARAWLRERELDDPDDASQLSVRRTVGADGRSRAYVNERPLPLADLQELTRQLIDQHGQGAHQALLAQETQCNVLDAFAGCSDLAAGVASTHAGWRAAERELAAARAQAGLEADTDWLQRELAELDRHAADIAAHDEIARAHARLATAEAAIQALSQASAQLADDDDNVLRRLNAIGHTLGRLAVAHPGAASAVALLDEARVQVEEAARELAGYLQTLAVDPERLAELDARLAQVFGLARRHRTTPAGLGDVAGELRDRLARAQARAASVPALEQAVASSRAQFQRLAQQLAATRRSAAPAFSRAVEAQMHTLGMPAGVFGVAFAAAESRHGVESVEFQVSTNPGMPPAPLARIASGGELSRISLGITVIAAARARTPTLVLDEADVGVGGAVADALGRTLRLLGDHAQVLCITHVAQVAAQGHRHLHVDKTPAGTAVRELSSDGRIDEVARMIGGATLTEKARARAEEMLAQAEDAPPA